MVNIVGGEDKYDQWKRLKKGCELLVGTPGRLIELVGKGAVGL